MAALSTSLLTVSIAIRDTLSPALREIQFKLGRWGLEWYLAQSWHQRLAYDIRAGRFTRNVADALSAFRTPTQTGRGVSSPRSVTPR